MQQTLKEFLDSIEQPHAEDFYEEDAISDYDFLHGQFELAQEILGKYFTERNYE